MSRHMQVTPPHPSPQASYTATHTKKAPRKITCTIEKSPPNRKKQHADHYNSTSHPDTTKPPKPQTADTSTCQWFKKSQSLTAYERPVPSQRHTCPFPRPKKPPSHAKHPQETSLKSWQMMQHMTPTRPNPHPTPRLDSLGHQAPTPAPTAPPAQTTHVTLKKEKKEHNMQNMKKKAWNKIEYVLSVLKAYHLINISFEKCYSSLSSWRCRKCDWYRQLLQQECVITAKILFTFHSVSLHNASSVFPWKFQLTVPFEFWLGFHSIV